MYILHYCRLKKTHSDASKISAHRTLISASMVSYLRGGGGGGEERKMILRTNSNNEYNNNSSDYIVIGTRTFEPMTYVDSNRYEAMFFILRY